MSYVVVHQFPGGTQSQYEASVADAHPADGSLPPGQLSHIAGPSADGWTIVVVYDSKENWETFRDEILMPKMAAGIEGGFTAPPQESGFEVFTNVSA
jgi:hypothetical protein